MLWRLPLPTPPSAFPAAPFVPVDPEDEVPNCARVRPGDHIPSIPAIAVQSRFRLPADAAVAGWRRRQSRCRTSSSVVMGNDDRPSPGYAAVNPAHGLARSTDNVEIYGLAKNLFRQDYATSAPTDAGALRNVAGDPAHGVGRNALMVPENPRHDHRRLPLTVYGGQGQF